MKLMSYFYDDVIETLLETQRGVYVLALALNNQEEADFFTPPCYAQIQLA